MKWLMAQMGQIGPMFGQHNHFLTMSADANPYSSARYREQARRLYAALDLQLATNDWLGGGDYSIADIATYPWASYCERHGFSWSAFPALDRWFRAVAARPAVARADVRLATPAPIPREPHPTAKPRKSHREGKE